VLLVMTSSRRPRSQTSFRTDMGDVQRSGSGDVRLSTVGTLFELAGHGDREDLGDVRSVRDAWGVALDGIAIGVFVDGAPREMRVDPPRTTPQGPTHAVAHAEIDMGQTEIDAEIGYTLVRSPAALLVSLRLRSVQEHAIALSLGARPGTMVPFVRGTGILADSGDASGPSVVLEGGQRSVAVGAASGDLRMHFASPEEASTQPLFLTVTGPERVGHEAVPLFVHVAPDPGAAAEGAARLRHEPVRRVQGRVVGGGEGVEVWGIGSSGRVILHVRPDAAGRFVAVAPPVEVGFYATMLHTRGSPIVMRPPTDDSELELTMLPGGEVHVQVSDSDTGAPLTARLIVHGIAPTADPNFGPDYRASGAGPLIDALRGEAIMPLPSGRYRVLVTRGPEYTMDEQPVDVSPGSSHPLKLSIRHVIDTPGLVGCDFHVHARPSFDAPVLPEDRVLSLVAAGVDFAVPSEHNVVGHYGPALAALGIEGDLGWVPGIEVTTARPSLGHFNVFPYEGSDVPPFRRTTVRQIFAKAREGDPSRVLQVNHPRLAKGIGYFDVVGLDTKTMHATGEWRDDFDSLEVFNGHDCGNRAKVEAVLFDWLRLLEKGHRFVATGDSDSHRIQYQWAGYPRTYVALPPDQAGDTGKPIDGTALVASLKAGHAFVTSGPFVEASIDGHGPGDTVTLRDPVARLHVRARAAPWIDVTEIEVLVGTATVARVGVKGRPCDTATPTGSKEEAARSSVRFEGDLDVPVPSAGGFVVVVVRGTRAMDNVLPYMPIQPLAFTNPIWIAGPEVAGRGSGR
jgi:hypothetical protein